MIRNAYYGLRSKATIKATQDPTKPTTYNVHNRVKMAAQTRHYSPRDDLNGGLTGSKAKTPDFI